MLRSKARLAHSPRRHVLLLRRFGTQAEHRLTLLVERSQPFGTCGLYVIAVRSGPSEGIAMINLSLRRYLPGWFRSETGDFYLTILFAAAATTELTYWFLSLPL